MTRRSLGRVVATVFGAGYAPLAPGSVGALVAVPAAWALLATPVWLRATVCAAVTAVGIAATHLYLAGDRDRDPGEVVIDEFAGLLITASFVPRTWLWLAAAYLLFRLLDISKPGPIGMADRQVHGALGVMLDDVIAGLLAGALLLAASLALARA